VASLFPGSAHTPFPWFRTRVNTVTLNEWGKKIFLEGKEERNGFQADVMVFEQIYRLLVEYPSGNVGQKQRISNNVKGKLQDIFFRWGTIKRKAFLAIIYF
jgi:hypothetical protein